ncbi:DNA cytosine methyltransferase [Streptomyces uncialis]|uniref:DNA cytosine methyltransferase n=1 Tax=Streptomyces uncialis TaxID=1048205 RepID=UPI003793C258
MQAPRIVDLFAGPGGLDVAAQRLGVPTVGIEWDGNACATRRAAEANAPEGATQVRTVEGDVRDHGPADFPEANVLAGGPPCQPYTVAGKGNGRKALDAMRAYALMMAAGEDVGKELAALPDVRVGLVLEPLRWALEALAADRPYDVIVLEQVVAARHVWEVFGTILRERGYSVDHGVLRTEQFGVPQTRRRAILVARLDGDARLPDPTHRAYRKGVDREAGDVTLSPWVPMGRTEDGGEPFISRPEPFEVISNYGTGGDPKDRGRRLSHQPAATVTGKIFRNRVVGPDGHEYRWTYEEAGRLQTFPAGYPWSGGDVAQQIGNAVPPLLAAHVLAAALRLDEETLARAVDSLSGHPGPNGTTGADHDPPTARVAPPVRGAAPITTSAPVTARRVPVGSART